MLHLRVRGQIAGRIDKELASHLETKIKCWRGMLKRFVALVKNFLYKASVSGVTFTGSGQHIPESSRWLWN